MIGVDIIRISRVEGIYADLAKRLLSDGELKELAARESESAKAEYVAGRFAGKEAYVKASGQKSVTYKDISILDDSSGRPRIYLKGRECGEISLSHDDYAIAFVLLA